MSPQLILKQKQQQQQQQKQQLTVSQILRVYGKQFRQISEKYSDGHNDRCALGVLMSYFGWDGRDDYNALNGLFAALGELKYADVNEDLLISLNDSGCTFDEIADYLDRINE
jgi:hypothetical protein